MTLASQLLFASWENDADPFGYRNMVKGSAPIQMMKKSITSVRGELVEPHSESTGEALWREKEKLALAWLEETLSTLKGPLTSGAWLGTGVK